MILNEDLAFKGTKKLVLKLSFVDFKDSAEMSVSFLTLILRPQFYLLIYNNVQRKRELESVVFMLFKL